MLALVIKTIISSAAGALLKFLLDPITKWIERAHYVDEGKKEERLDSLQKRIDAERGTDAARAAALARVRLDPGSLHDTDGFRRD